MNRNSILDFLGLVRAIGLAGVCIGVVAAAVMLALSILGLGRGWTGPALAAWLGMFVILPGILVICIATLSRVFVRRMRFYSETTLR
jgi:hypothetical protein